MRKFKEEYIMPRTILDLNKIASDELGIEVEFAESHEFHPEEVNELLEEEELKPFTENILVHSCSNEDNTITTILTGFYPEYEPYVLLKEDEDGKVLFKKDFR
jgi:hypothetical protein